MHARTVATGLLVVLVSSVAAAASMGVANGGSVLLQPNHRLESIRPLQPDPGLLVEADAEWRLWPENAGGQTYGTPTETVYGYHEPDLIRVEATNGRTGYAYRDQLAGAEPNSPEQALQWQASQDGMRIVIPVYNADGSTQIGEFVAREGE